MKKPYQIEAQRAVKQLEAMAAEGNPAVQMVLPMAEMVGWLRKGVGELIRQAGLQLMDRNSSGGQGRYGSREGAVEVLLTRQVADDPNEWECLVRPGRKIGIGEKLYFSYPPCAPPELEAEVVERGSFGERRIRFAPVIDLF